jgi:ABC-type transport system involved in cytochrome c biogenesis permease subunit
MMTLLRLFAVLLTLAAVTAQGAGDATPDRDPAPKGERIRMEPWPQEVLDAASRIPIQEGGRIKPFHSYAGFQMLRLNGKRTFVTEWGEKLTPVAWFLDCMFFPEQAWDYRVVRVEDTKVVKAIGVDTAGKNRRDRFSMRELNGSLTKLLEQGGTLSRKPPDERNSIEVQIVVLSEALPWLRYILGTFDFARQSFEVAGLPGFDTAFPGRKKVRYLELLPKFASLEAALRAPPKELSRRVYDFRETSRLTQELSKYVHFLPPSDPKDEEFLSSADVIAAMIRGAAVDARQVAILRRIETMSDARTDMVKFAPQFVALSDELVKRSTDRGEFSKIDLEVSFYKSDWFTKAEYAFVLAFLCCAFLWIRGGVKPIYWIGWTAAISGEAMLVLGIVLRCVIRSRPPITTPYEAILFIVAVGVLIMMFVEWTRRSVMAMSVSTVAGGLGIMLANWHEGIEKSDTMQPLVAVLDTNFWLSTHVTTVTLGYCAGSLAALLAHVYIFGKLYQGVRGLLGHVGIGPTAKFYSDLSRIIYGVMCFGLLFSTVGTILGGVWANDSWGRFWGWDPKENGALMLVLGFLVILHARMGGYVREFGIALCAIVLGIIVMWAFWGVNLYNIGMHSYGFTETKKAATILYYWTEWSVLALGISAWGLQRMAKARR